MGDNSKIEWTEATWNPLVGCSVVSPGCTNCYAMQLAGTRLDHTPRYSGLTHKTKAGPVWNGTVRLVEEVLHQPLQWKRPRMIFVNSMSDLFHESVPDEWIDRIFAIMALCPQHTFQVLTKRAARMQQWFEERWQPAPAQSVQIGSEVLHIPAQAEGDDRHERVYQAAGEFLDLDTESDRFWNPDGSRKWPGWPLPNVWIGVSTEDQAHADERIPHLLRTPAAVRFVSAEPLLGPIDFNRIHESFELPGGGDEHRWESALDGKRFDIWSESDIEGFPKLDWVIVGGESGAKARPMHPDWVRSIRKQCAAAGVPFFFKQWGEWAPYDSQHIGTGTGARIRGNAAIDIEGNKAALERWAEPGIMTFHRLGKSITGRQLDGRTHDAMPEARA